MIVGNQENIKRRFKEPLKAPGVPLIMMHTSYDVGLFVLCSKNISPTNSDRLYEYKLRKYQ